MSGDRVDQQNDQRGRDTKLIEVRPGGRPGPPRVHSSARPRHGCAVKQASGYRDRPFPPITLNDVETIPATGKAIDVPSCDVFTIEGGKVSVFECYYFGTILLVQIGVLANVEASSRK
jgi:hypothetical protein